MDIWKNLIELQDSIEHLLSSSMEQYEEPGMERFNKHGWTNKTWKSEKFRRAHIDVVDARGSKKLWMMHVCIFPHIKSGAPIYGFDVIAGPNKITGAFHDFSPVNSDDHALHFFYDLSRDISWNKERELPDWAKAIFSKNMIAAGNIQDDRELKQLCDIVKISTLWYLNVMNVKEDMPSSYAHNRYAYYQKQNPHTPKTMKALGLNEEDVDLFVNKCLFPEV